MIELKSRSYITVLLHVLLWTLFAFILLVYLPFSWNISFPFQFWVKQGVILTILVVVFYFNSYVLVPRLLLKNKNLLFVFVIVVISLVAGSSVKVVDNLLSLPQLMQKAFNDVGINRPRRDEAIDVFLVLMTFVTVGISTSVTLIQSWQGDKQSREALEKEKVISELSYLKAQINPHFFFNTLNNIYALTHVDVENSRRALHKLSRMMRYLLYDTQAGITPLSKEISFITDYMELMKLRLHDTTTVTFEEPVITNDVQIAPMLFLPYIENAFKHGVSTTKPSVISIQIKIENRILSMTVKNTIFSENMITADEYGGIGLTNTKRRLDLLYPGKHTFSATRAEDGNEFVVNLTLTLDDA